MMKASGLMAGELMTNLTSLFVVSRMQPTLHVKWRFSASGWWNSALYIALDRFHSTMEMSISRTAAALIGWEAGTPGRYTYKHLTGYSDCWLIPCWVTAVVTTGMSWDCMASIDVTWCHDWYDSSAPGGLVEDAAERRRRRQLVEVFRACRLRQQLLLLQMNVCVVVSRCLMAPTWSSTCRYVSLISSILIT